MREVRERLVRVMVREVRERASKGDGEGGEGEG